MGQSHWLYCEKGPVEAVFPSPAEEVQPATGAAENSSGSAILESVPVFIYNSLVWFSYQIRYKETTTDSQECRRGLSVPLCPAFQELYTSRVRKRAKKITLDPSHPAHSLFELMPPGLHYRAMCTKTARHKNSFFPPGHIPPEQHITHLSTGHPYTTQQIFSVFSTYALFCLDIFTFSVYLYYYCYLEFIVDSL